MYLKKEIFLVVGLGKSGLSCAKFILNSKAKCYFYEENQTIKEKNEEYIKSLGGEFVSKEELENVIQKITILVLSPGVPIDCYIAKLARQYKKRIIGELELGGEFIKNPIIAITGTNGKTTSTYLLEHILNKAGLVAYAVGNVGTPITSIIDSVSSESVLVAEVSSYQLETCNRLMPHIGVVLNVTPDHLSRHYTMENYVSLKCKLLNNLRESEFAVLNYDDINCREMKNKTRANVIYFSTKEKVDGAYIIDDKIFYKNEEVLNVENITLKGEHNLSNVLAIVSICKILDIKNEVINIALSSFKGAKHRLELVNEINQIYFYNDSKSTNPDSTIKAIEAIKNNKILLLGGREKNVDYSSMFNYIKLNSVKEIVLFGEARFSFYELTKKLQIKNVHFTKKLKDAVKLSYSLASQGEVVLLSPACSSYDEYNNYEERGEDFINAVNELL